MYAARMELQADRHDRENDPATWCRGCDTFPDLNVAALMDEENPHEFFLSVFRCLKVINGKDSYGGANTTNGDGPATLY
jgi:hypothetical protein